MTRNQFDLTDRLTLTDFKFNLNWSTSWLTELPASHGGRQRRVTAVQWRSGSGEEAALRRSGDDPAVERQRRFTAVERRRRIPAVARVTHARRGDTSGSSSGFVRAPIAAWLVSTALSRREKHGGGFACARFSTVRKIWLNYWTDKNKAYEVAVSGDSRLQRMVVTSSTSTLCVVDPATSSGDCTRKVSHLFLSLNFFSFSLSLFSFFFFFLIFFSWCVGGENNEDGVFINKHFGLRVFLGP